MDKPHDNIDNCKERAEEVFEGFDREAELVVLTLDAPDAPDMPEVGDTDPLDVGDTAPSAR
jgi:hypothetical protein